MSSSSILALVVVLNAASGATESTVAILPADQCLASMRALWSVPAETVATADGFPIPALDAYCVDPRSAPAMVAAFVPAASP